MLFLVVKQWIQVLTDCRCHVTHPATRSAFEALRLYCAVGPRAEFAHSSEILFPYRLHEFEMNVSVYDNLFNFILWSRLVPIPYFNLLQWNLHCNNYFLLPIALCGWSPCPGFIRGCKVESKTCLVGSKKLETLES